MTDKVGNETQADSESKPSCSACGAPMVPFGQCDGSRRGSKMVHRKEVLCKNWKATEFRCLSCGSTTGLAEEK